MGFYGYFIGYYEIIIFELFITLAGFINMYLNRGGAAKNYDSTRSENTPA